jgi:hypothetical protein
MRRIRRRKNEILLGPQEWLGADAIDGTFFRVLPSRTESVTVEEVQTLDQIFRVAITGEIPGPSWHNLATLFLRDCSALWISGRLYLFQLSITVYDPLRPSRILLKNRLTLTACA